MSNQIEELANLIKNSNRAIILTGAGISTDSGLPDFRSDNGFWKSNKPIYFNDFIKNEQSRILSWKRNIELNNLLEKINPKISINIPIGSLGLKILRSKALFMEIIINYVVPQRSFFKSNLFLRNQRMKCCLNFYNH